MPYIITAKRPMDLRDGTLPTDPMYRMVPGVPHLFGRSPGGRLPPGDDQMSVEIAPADCRVENSEPLPIGPVWQMQLKRIAELEAANKKAEPEASSPVLGQPPEVPAELGRYGKKKHRG